MKRRLLAIAAIFVILLSGCGHQESNEKYVSKLVSTNYANLWYDTRTNIVYYISESRELMSVYYCEHGEPYKFNSTTGELECINN